MTAKKNISFHTSLFALLVLLSIVSTTIAHAEDVTRAPEAEADDEDYLDRAGQFSSGTSYKYQFASGDVYRDSNGHLLRTFNRDQDMMVQRFGYGITGRVTVWAQADYVAVNNSHNYMPNNTTSLTHSSGFDDPTIGVTYRAVKQKTCGYNLDLGLSYSPDIVPALQASRIYDGSVAQGGQTLGGVIAISHNWAEQGFSLRGAFSPTYYDKRSSQDQATLTSNTVDPSWAYGFSLLARQRVWDDFSVLGGVGFAVAQNTKVTSATGTQATGIPGGNTNFTAGFNYDFLPGILAVEVQDKLYLYGDSSTSYPDAPQNNTTTKNQWGDTVVVSLKAAF